MIWKCSINVSIWMRLPEKKALPFHDMGAYEKSTDVNQIAAIYKNIGRIQKLRIWDVREAMYPEKMTTEQLAEAMDEIAENTVQEVMLDLQSGNIHYYVFYSILC